MSEKIEILLYVCGAVAIALLANYLAATWASKDNKWSLLLLAIVVISPLVFITFGLVTTRIGVALASGTIDSLLTITTVLLGLLTFGEWNKLSLYQYIGLLLVLVGLLVVQFAPSIKV